jgi:hypothetical protein
MDLIPINIDTSKHMICEWEKIYAVLKKECPDKVWRIREEVLNTAQDSFGEPLVNVPCTGRTYKSFLSILNRILNEYGFMLDIDCSDQANSYF